jgi:hypothetical protein
VAPLGRAAVLVAVVCFMAVFGGFDTPSRAKPKKDKKPPVVTGARAERLPDADGWYNHPVRVVFSGEDEGGEEASGVSSCTDATYAGPDSADATVEGSCVDVAGNVSHHSFTFHLKYDATPPVVRAVTPDRPARSGGWFNGPVRFAVHAADATSGLAACPAVTYAGPDSAAASISAVCRDRAGNVANRAFGLKYDMTPPQLGRLKTAVGDRRVTLRWPASPDDRSVRVLRSPDFAGAAPAVAFSGVRARFVDTRVVNGRRYTYEVRATDAAGNMSVRRVVAVPHPHLIRPAGGAVVAAGTRLLLRWTPVRRTLYYNVQLFRDGRKVLSRWPTAARYRLPAQWMYQGRARRLDPGRYIWLVWPGRGLRSTGRYGARVGRLAFTVR